MKSNIIAFAAAALLALPCRATVTLQQCHDAAESNYPEIRRHELIDATAQFDIDNAKKNYLPQVTAYGQASWQNKVAQLPGSLTGVLESMGGNVAGLSKDQYRIGADATQNLWDGGRTKAQIARVEASSRVSQAQSDLAVYQVRQRINDLYFGILLLDVNLRQNAEKIKMLEADVKVLNSMYRGGTATKSDAQRVQAEIASARQERASIVEAGKAYRNVLSLLTGLDLAHETLEVPAMTEADPVVTSHPQLRLIEAQRSSLDAQRQAIDASLKPQVSAFASAFYGRPGYDNFDAMMRNRFSFNFMVGVKASWSIGEWYRKKNNLAKLNASALDLDVSRDNFLFQNRLTTASQQGQIAAKRAQLEQDDEIVALRTAVRKATESKLKHGIVVSDDLVRDITSEVLARQARDYREIEILKNIYDIKYTTNNQ